MMLKLLLVVALALGVGNVGQYIWSKWQASSYKAQIEKLQKDLLAKEIELKSREAELRDRETQVRVERKVVYVQKDVDKVVSAGDDPRMHQLFVEHGMLPKQGGAAGR